MEKELKILFRLGESVEDIINRIKKCSNTPKTSSLTPKATPTPNKVVSPQPETTSAKSHVNHADKSTTSVHYAKTTHEIKKAVELTCAATTSPENSTTEFKDPSNISEVDGSLLEIWDNVLKADYGYSKKLQDYNFKAPSMCYFQVFSCMLDCCRIVSLVEQILINDDTTGNER